jgi:hypothetical protein
MPMTVVCDPQIPSTAARLLSEANPSELVPFSAAPEKLVAARQAPPSDKQAWVVITAITAVILWYVTVRMLVPPSESNIGGATISALLALWLSIVSLMMWRGDRPRRRRPALLTKYHRRYVVPSVDMDPEARQVWSRAARAADTITESEVVKEQRVDSVRVSVVLPDWLWDIAEKLALLSEVRAGQRKISFDLNAGAPEVARALDQQRRVRDIAAADIERQVQQLQVLADRVAEADAAVRKVRASQDAVRQLAALNDSHANLLARVDHSAAADAHEAQLLSRDAQAVIAQADDAVRQANEAARSIALPGE